MKSDLRILGIVSLVAFCLLDSPSLFGVGVDYTGYFRSRANFYYNLDLDRDEKPQTRAYTDFRFRLNPEFLVTDQIRIKTSLNFMDGAFGQSPFRGLSHSNPTSSQDPQVRNTDGGNVGRVMESDAMTSWVYGGALAPDAASTTTDLQPLQVRRAWAEIETPVGILKVGRMPFDFGLGILGNAGDGVDQEVGSTRDRIAFETALGNYYLMPGVSWFYEGQLDRSQDDVFEYFFHFGRKTEGQHLSMLLSYFGQDSGLNTSGTNGSLAKEGTGYWTIAFYAQNQFDFANLQLEANFHTGKYLGRDLFALNVVGRSDWKFSALDLRLEAGYATGTSDSDGADGDIRGFAFNRDYNVSYLLFEEALPGGTQVPGDSADPRATAPHSGAISNAIYLRARSEFDVAPYYRPAINVLIPFADQKSNGAGGILYGVEYNLINQFPITGQWGAELTFAHFIPGTFYENVSAAHSTFLLMGGMNLRF